MFDDFVQSEIEKRVLCPLELPLGEGGNKDWKSRPHTCYLVHQLRDSSKEV